MSANSSQKITLLVILMVASVVRLWGVQSYAPVFWDEAKYLSEIAGHIPQFSVNAGAFAFLKLGYLTIGGNFYAQIVTAIFGLLTLLGLYFLGKNSLPRDKLGVTLGLLMAGQGAIMPYFVRYSRHALPSGFALFFFVLALNFYLLRLHHKQNTSDHGKTYGLLIGSLFAIAMVPTCSFKFLLPTLILFLFLEIIICHRKYTDKSTTAKTIFFVSHLVAGAMLFAILPWLVSLLSGYSGWLERALELSRFHSQIDTMRATFHFLYPVHLYYLTGIPMMICFIGGLVLLFYRRLLRNPVVDTDTRLVLLLGFLVYFLFFGALSHLQAARLYALTLPFVAFAVGIFLLRLWAIRRPVTRAIVILFCLLLTATMGYHTLSYVGRSNCFRRVGDVVMQNMRVDGHLFTNAKGQLVYSSMTAERGNSFHYSLHSFIHTEKVRFKEANPPMVMVHDPVDLVATTASWDKYDRLEDVDQIRRAITDYRHVAKSCEHLATFEDEFTSTPDYYLEDIYSWKSYRIIRQVMPSMRTEALLYRSVPARSIPYQPEG